MSDVEHLIIFHYNREFEFELNRPQFKGGRQKKRYLSSNVTYNELSQIALKALSWETTSDEITLKYLLHNDSLFFFLFYFIDIVDDNDINGLLKLSRSEAKGTLVFISRRLCDEGIFQHTYDNRYVLK